MGFVRRGNKRNFDCIIIDEIDNICIDNIKNITELLDNFYGYKFFKVCLFIYIYNDLVKLNKKLLEKVKFNDVKHQISVLSTKKQKIETLFKNAKKIFGNLKTLAKKTYFLSEHLNTFIKFRLKRV